MFEILAPKLKKKQQKTKKKTGYTVHNHLQNTDLCIEKCNNILKSLILNLLRFFCHSSAADWIDHVLRHI